MASDRRDDDQGPAGWGEEPANPTDRAKGGTKRSLLTDGRGVPLGVAIPGADTHDKGLVWRTLASVPIEHPAGRPEPEVKENLCMDKGSDSDDVREIVGWWGDTAQSLSGM